GPGARRMLGRIGRVAVFGASNFPFAFSVAGGDPASALAAGNPVVIKAHPSHLLTSQRSFAALDRAAQAYGAPEGTFGIVYGQEAGAQLVADEQVAAVAFTGALSTGKILQQIIDQRPTPIPFYGELSSLNPLVITPGAAREHAEDIGAGLFASVTGSAGQLCTKPGLAFVPHGEDGDRLVADLVSRATGAGAQTVLNARIHSAFDEIRTRLVEDGRARPLLTPTHGDDGLALTPGVLEIEATEVTEAVTEEAFGPLVVLVRYRTAEEVQRALQVAPASLTATIHSTDAEEDLRTQLTTA